MNWAPFTLESHDSDWHPTLYLEHTNDLSKWFAVTMNYALKVLSP
jgi:hypothetical protein